MKIFLVLYPVIGALIGLAISALIYSLVPHNDFFIQHFPLFAQLNIMGLATIGGLIALIFPLQISEKTLAKIFRLSGVTIIFFSCIANVSINLALVLMTVAIIFLLISLWMTRPKTPPN